jgi:SAM-dependent methyltransferase
MKQLRIPGVPFSELGDENVIKKALTHRLKVTQKFIGYNISDLHTLDIGQSNKIGRALGIKDNTLETDFNREILAPSDNYDLITCFEVLEHVMNPLFMMDRIYELLRPGGICYLTTPIRRRTDVFYGCRGHFTEYKPREMGLLFKYVGFREIRYKKFLYWDWDFMFWGIRPFFRVTTQRHQLWGIRK